MLRAIRRRLPFVGGPAARVPRAAAAPLVVSGRAARWPGQAFVLPAPPRVHRLPLRPLVAMGRTLPVRGLVVVLPGATVRVHRLPVSMVMARTGRPGALQVSGGRAVVLSVRTMPPAPVVRLPTLAVLLNTGRTSLVLLNDGSTEAVLLNPGRTSVTMNYGG